MAAAVVAVVTAAGGTYVAVDSRESGRAAAEQQLVRELEQPRSRISTLTTPSGEPVGYLVASGATVEFIADGLLPSPAGTKYWAWAINAGRTTVARPLAGFDTSNQRPVVHRLAASLAMVSAASTFAISLEPGTATPARPTQIVATGVSQV
ncbi:anti-sigma factor domain-containing protein [Fodinicola feengrottensis]|uniref:anti-sigma factor domain-containing protein n=1 Tax=Fodinicola feengrottensis TaxID=435914 RepID=UPI003CD095CC